MICVCGDMLESRNVKRYEQWLLNLPADIVLVVPGNHDIELQETWEPRGEGKVFNPIVKPVIYQGVTFGGFCWSYTDYPEMAAYWSFMTIDIQRIKLRMNKVPPCDVLLSHSPPSCREMLIRDNVDIGVPNMIEWALSNQCKHIFCGHIHEHGGTINEVAGINVINAACSLIEYSL